MSLTQWLDAIDTFGALGLVVAALWAFYTRRIRSKGEVEESDTEWNKRLAEMETTYSAQLKYADDRRAEERADKVLAYDRLAALVDAVDNIATLLQGVREEIIRGPRR